MPVLATEPVPLVYDFGGFERRFYETTYTAPGAPELAARIEKLMPDSERVASSGLNQLVVVDQLA